MRIDAFRCDNCGKREDAYTGMYPLGWERAGIPRHMCPPGGPDRERHYCSARCKREGERVIDEEHKEQDRLHDERVRREEERQERLKAADHARTLR